MDVPAKDISLLNKQKGINPHRNLKEDKMKV